VNHSSRPRHVPGGRGLALWLILAQLSLFGTSGLAHRHLEFAGAHAAATAACDASVAASDHARVDELRGRHHGAPPDCALCQAVRGTVVSLATAPGVVFCVTLCGHAPAGVPLSLPIRLVGSCSTRAPPTL
jgi:hypothetical protein